MPFTFFHFGPPLLFIVIISFIKNIKWKENWIIYFAIFIGSVIPDLQGFIIILFDLDGSFHGFSHTIIGSLVYAVSFGLVIFGITLLYPELMVYNSKIFMKSIIWCWIGIILFHFIPDMFIWDDMQIFWPFSNRSYGDPNRYQFIALILFLMMLAGIILLALKLLIAFTKQQKK